MSMLLNFSFNSSVFALLYWYTFLGGLFTFLGYNYSIKSKALNTKQCKQLLDICQDNCLEQVVNEETHFTEKSKSILEHATDE
jgi:hypothetical protein